MYGGQQNERGARLRAVISDDEDSVLEVHVAPTSVHYFLFPRTGRQGELV
jgi:hypothetical protein